MQSVSDLFWTGITLLLVMGTLSIVTTNWRLLKPPRLFNLCQETHPVPCSGLTPWQSVALLRVLVPGPGAPGLDHPRQVAAEGRDQDPGHQDLDQLPARGRQRPLSSHRPLCPGKSYFTDHCPCIHICSHANGIDFIFVDIVCW